MNLKAIFTEIDETIKKLENENQKLKEENQRLNEELDNLYGEEIDTFPLERIFTTSELIKAIEERYKNAGMKVVSCFPNKDNKTFTLEFGCWNWSGKICFIGKQYFRQKRFSFCNCDGYDDPEKFIGELLGIKNFGMGGIARNWYRRAIPIPDDLIFDKIINE